MRSLRTAVAIGSAVVLGSAASGHAQSARVPDPAAGAAQPASPWTFALTGYGWLSATDGTVGAGRARIDVHNSFTDTIRDSDTVFALMLRGEARRDRLGLFLDGMYARLGYDDIRVGRFVANATSSQWILEFGTAWEVARGPAFADGRIALDVIGGGRWTRLKNEVAFNSGGPSGTSTVDWVDPFGGLRLRGQFSPRWDFTLRGDIGGGIGGTRFAWQAISTVGYRFTLFGLDTVAQLGYRALSQDYESSKLVYDVTLHGPLIGLTARF